MENDSRILSVIRRIVDADLPGATESVAVRLILRASHDTGQVNLTWDELVGLSRCESRDNARRHLIRIANRKLIHYSTNDNVYVTWLAWLMEDMDYDPYATTKNARGSAKNARGSAKSVVENLENDEPTKNDLQSAKNARGSAKSALQRSFSVTLSSSSSSSSDPEGGYEFRLDLVALGKRMLSECGIFPADAGRLAAAYPFEELREQVFAWRNDPKALGPGSLKHRIEHAFHHPPLTDDDLNDTFYLRYRTPEEIAAAPVVEELPTEPEPAPPPAVVNAGPAWGDAIVKDSEHYKLWAEVLSDLELTVSRYVYSTWLRDTVPLSTSGADWIIGVPDGQAYDWLRSRMAAKISRLLSLACHTPITLEFKALEVAHAHE